MSRSLAQSRIRGISREDASAACESIGTHRGLTCKIAAKCHRMETVYEYQQPIYHTACFAVPHRLRIDHVPVLFLQHCSKHLSTHLPQMINRLSRRRIRSRVKASRVVEVRSTEANIRANCDPVHGNRKRLRKIALPSVLASKAGFERDKFKASIF